MTRFCSILSFFFLALIFSSTVSYAQSDSLGSYCNVHYITSDAPDILPFDDHCFVVEEYSLSNPRRFRAVGPIDGGLDLFGHFPWAMNFYLPDVGPKDRLRIITPRDILAKDLRMKQGEFYVTVSDNRERTRYDPISEEVNFVSVGGTGRITAYREKTGDMLYPEYDLQIDLRLKQVDRSGEYPRLSGEAIRLRMVLVIEALE